jgi:hypothetical protein
LASVEVSGGLRAVQANGNVGLAVIPFFVENFKYPKTKPQFCLSLTFFTK